MKSRAIGILIWLTLLATGLGEAQLSSQSIAERDRWERFLATAGVVAREQMAGESAVTRPWKLTLRAGDVEALALWKDVEGRPRGVLDCWRFEIAAYRLDKHLGLGMVPPTVERLEGGKRGSCQLWVDGVKTLRDRLSEAVETGPDILFNWRRAGYLQQAFDNLIGNADRNQGNILVRPDWRWILIDHSRSFRTERRLFFTEEAHKEQFMRSLPRAFVAKVRALDEPVMRRIGGRYLTGREIKAVLARRKLLLREIERIIRRDGEAAVLY